MSWFHGVHHEPFFLRRGEPTHYRHTHRGWGYKRRGVGMVRVVGSSPAIARLFQTSLQRCDLQPQLGTLGVLQGGLQVQGGSIRAPIFLNARNAKSPRAFARVQHRQLDDALDS